MIRMRIERGRVMHAVKRRSDGRIESLCRKPNKYLKGHTEPRATGHETSWTTENLLDYPNCTHCPPEETT